MPKKNAKAPTTLKASDRKIVERFIKEDTQRALKDLDQKRQQEYSYVERPRAIGYDDFSAAEKELVDAAVALAVQLNEALGQLRAAGIHNNNQIYASYVRPIYFYKNPPPAPPVAEFDYVKARTEILAAERAALLELISTGSGEARTFIDSYTAKLSGLVNSRKLLTAAPADELVEGEPV